MKALWIKLTQIPHFDKVEHFGASLIATVLFDWKFAAGLGLGKEVGDHFNPNSKFSVLDLVADALGIGVGLLIKCLLKHCEI